MSEPTRRTWRVADPYSGTSLGIAGWDWGGDGPLALLSHANGFCGAVWALVAEALHADYRVVAIDARGHGDSDAPPVPDGYEWDFFVSDLAGVARALCAETGAASVAYGIGNSFGGIVTAAVEARYPGLFDRVAMLDPPIHPDEALRAGLGIEPGERGPASVAEQARRRSAVFPSRDFVRRAWRGKPLFESWDPRAFELYVTHGFRDRTDGQVELKCRPEVEATIFESTGSLSVFDFAPDVGAPVLLARAANGFIDPKVFEYLAGRFPRCRLESVAAGHLMPMDAPEFTAQLLRDFAAHSRS